ncbi:MAG: TM0996/MTH895 family glutaredoxin-like protein [Spirochaetia bacterium]|nr:TM0996/MTH895 family glutaredoxin-like protein [Spirochaetia bacterium]
MTIQILGGGCPKCRQLEANAKAALEALALEADIQKVTDMDAILDMGVMVTPALAVDGKVLSSGKVLSADQVAALLKP